MQPLILRPHPEPFNFTDKWSHPLWKQRGVYLWSIEHKGGYLVSYAGQTVKGGANFDTRIWDEYKLWRDGGDRPVDIEQWKRGVRVELPKPAPPGHLERELAELTPLLRLWLMPLSTPAECDHAERWLVARLCEHPATRQFLANCNPHRYRPDPNWPVQIEAPPSVQIFGLTAPVPNDL